MRDTEGSAAVNGPPAVVQQEVGGTVEPLGDDLDPGLLRGGQPSDLAGDGGAGVQPEVDGPAVFRERHPEGRVAELADPENVQARRDVQDEGAVGSAPRGGSGEVSAGHRTALRVENPAAHLLTVFRPEDHSQVLRSGRDLGRTSAGSLPDGLQSDKGIVGGDPPQMEAALG